MARASVVGWIRMFSRENSCLPCVVVLRKAKGYGDPERLAESMFPK